MRRIGPDRLTWTQSRISERHMSTDKRNGKVMGAMPLRERRGVSLVELLIVISVSSVIIGVCVTTIHVLLRSERDQARAMRTAVTLSRLTEVLRQDVHATSNAAIVADEGKPAHLTLGDADGRQIVYTADEHLLQRAETTNGEETHRDTYHFPTGTTSRFERDEATGLVRLVIDVAPPHPDRMPQARTKTAGPRTLWIEAVSNRDRRFAGRGP